MIGAKSAAMTDPGAMTEATARADKIIFRIFPLHLGIQFNQFSDTSSSTEQNYPHVDLGDGDISATMDIFHRYVMATRAAAGSSMKGPGRRKNACEIRPMIIATTSQRAANSGIPFAGCTSGFRCELGPGRRARLRWDDLLAGRRGHIHSTTVCTNHATQIAGA